MRHYFKLTCAIAGLALGMPAGSATTPLVPGSRISLARAPAYRSALVAAKLLPAIAVTAQLHLLPAPLAVEETIEILDRWSRPADFWI
jgi:hypothetical protein